MSVLEELKKKIADIETQSLAMDGCRPTFTVSEIMDLIDSVESDKQKAESAQNVPNGDYISRRAAIDLVKFECGEWTGLAKTIGNRINEMPPAQPEQHEIGYSECANAMLKMWIDNVLTDGEYSRIMDKLNAHWAERREE